MNWLEKMDKLPEKITDIFSNKCPKCHKKIYNWTKTYRLYFFRVKGKWFGTYRNQETIDNVVYYQDKNFEKLIEKLYRWTRKYKNWIRAGEEYEKKGG